MKNDIRADLLKLSSDLKKLMKILSEKESKRIQNEVKKLREANGDNKK